MPSPFLTELALRTAANKTNRTLMGEGHTEEFKTLALQRSEELIRGSADKADITSQIKAQSEAISLAIKGLQLAYTAITGQLKVLQEQRLSFDQQRQAGISIFTIPTNKEESALSTEEKVIKAFIELTHRYPSFSTYLGIHNAPLTEEKKLNFYSVLPFYRMSEKVDRPLLDSKAVDKQRNAISLFLKSALPEAIADIDLSFQNDYRFIAFWVSAFQGKNYLNNRRAPRFIMMSLSNLLWNLQHPVDPKTGFPLSSLQCIKICRDVEECIVQLLNPGAPTCIEVINNRENKIISFLRKIEIHTRALRAAYVEEQLHELNIEDITNGAHHALRIMNKSILKLIYKRRNPATNKLEPDENAVNDIAYLIIHLNNLLIRNPSLIHAFNHFPAWISPAAGMNTPPKTVMDVLIIFTHLPWREQNALLAGIRKSNIPSALEFADTLKKFDEKFIKPVKDVSKAELKATDFDPKHQEVCTLTARRLIPFLTLIIKDQRIDVDSATTNALAKYSQEHPEAPTMSSGKQQVYHINTEADQGNGYYYWSLTSFIQKSSSVAKDLAELPKWQLRLIKIAELLDGIKELVQNYRHFLQNELFQNFLLNCLKKVREKYIELESYIGKVDARLSEDEHLDRSLQIILRTMTKDLNTSIENFQIALTNLERIVSAPEFTEQQRQLLAGKIKHVADQYRGLFAEESGLHDLVGIPMLPDEPALKPRPLPSIAQQPQSMTMADSRKVIALNKIVHRCYNALSYQSKKGHKGLLLRDLLSIIEGKGNFTEKQIKHILMELTRITASYRENWLFQAGYGQTRSARALIAAIKDPTLNSILPLASIIFEDANLNVMLLSDNQIIQQLRKLREGKKWQESSTKMSVRSFSD
jgi:hypothetical protein